MIHVFHVHVFGVEIIEILYGIIIIFYFITVGISDPLSALGTYTPAPGGPFSALTPSMWPQDILAKYHQVRIYLFILSVYDLSQLDLYC